MNTLNPYSGNWNFHLAAHLLRRTTFGPSKAIIDSAVNDGMESTITKLFEDKSFPELPIYFKFEDDPGVDIGETWVQKEFPVPQINGLLNARINSLRTWMMGILESRNCSIFGRMLLFWHEHLPVNDVVSGNFGYKYVETLMRNSMGNFKTMIEEITIDPMMLRFLNGNENTEESPNENYARELLELFTIGRGEDLGSGDLTNYTEQDVSEMARALTGWVGTFDFDTGTPSSVFLNPRHDQGTKELSFRFDNETVPNQGAEESKAIIDIIFQKEEVARFICRKLHIWFINAEITTEVETNIINPLAAQLIAANYEMEGIIKTLLSSEYFYQESLIGCKITSPIDFVLKATNTFDFTVSNDPIENYIYWERLNGAIQIMDMILLDPPTVAGWKAFYQAPLYDRIWIDAVSLQVREFVTDIFVTGVEVSGLNLELDLISFIAQFDEADNPNSLLDGIAQVLFSNPIAQNQHDFLKEILIPGLPDIEWTIEYSEFLANPSDPALLDGINTKLKALFSAMLKMPEFYLT